MESLLSNSLDPKHFQIEDVEGDNACFYRALANGLAFLSEGTTCDTVLKEKTFNHSKSLKDFYESDEWGYGGVEQECLARALQEFAYTWICDRPTLRAPLSDFDISIRDLVQMVHEMSHEDYVEAYQYFAGDLVLEEEEGGEVSLLENRWGSYVEQLALSEHFHLPIVVMSAQKYDERRGKLISGTIRNNKAIRGVRYRIYQSSGLEYMERGALPVFMIWKKGKSGGHYMATYPKQIKEAVSQLQDLLKPAHSS